MASSHAGDASRVLVAGTLDTKAAELRFVRDRLLERGLPATLVDLSTREPVEADDVAVSAFEVASHHPKGPGEIFPHERGRAVSAMTIAFERWMAAQSDVAGIVAAGGSGGTAITAPAMRVLPVGVPKVLVSTVASGFVGGYVGVADVTMMHSVADIQGLNSITRRILKNGANALAGMVEGRRSTAAAAIEDSEKPALGITMFGVTTPCVRRLTATLEDRFDCLVFHATGTGGRAMEALLDAGLLETVIDVTTSEVADLLMGGVFAATEDRFGAIIRSNKPYVGTCGGLDLVNFAAPDTVPERYRGRLLYRHNPQVTLMRTEPEENAALGRWIGERLNRMEGQVRFLLPEGGLSALDVAGQPFHDPAADAALFDALERTVKQTPQRRLVRCSASINEPAFAAALLRAFEEVGGGREALAPPA